MSIYGNRRLGNQIAMVLSTLASLVGLFFLAAILWTLLAEGLPALSPAIFVEMTPPPPGDGGGLANAIFGSVAMTLVAILVATPDRHSGRNLFVRICRRIETGRSRQVHQ